MDRYPYCEPIRFFWLHTILAWLDHDLLHHRFYWLCLVTSAEWWGWKRVGWVDAAGRPYNSYLKNFGAPPDNGGSAT